MKTLPLRRLKDRYEKNIRTTNVYGKFAVLTFANQEQKNLWHIPSVGI